MTRLAYNTGPLKEPSRPPQAILNQFDQAVEKARVLCLLAKGREVIGCVECCRKLIHAERQKAEHILAAADRALVELG